MTAVIVLAKALGLLVAYLRVGYGCFRMWTAIAKPVFREEWRQARMWTVTVWGAPSIGWERWTVGEMFWSLLMIWPLMLPLFGLGWLLVGVMLTVIRINEHLQSRTKERYSIPKPDKVMQAALKEVEAIAPETNE